MTNTVLVTGVRGKTGRVVAERLAGRNGFTVRGGSSSPDLVRTAGVDPVAFDWARPDTWADALDGVDAIYLMRPDIEDAPERVARLVAEAPRDARIVLLSEMGAQHLPPGGWFFEVERAVTAGDRPWTILRPTWFQQVFTDERYFRRAIADRGVLAMPTGGAPVSWVDAGDIAAVAVEALTAPDHAGAAYTISGPEALRLDEVAQLIGDAIGRPVRAVDQSQADAVDGLEPWFVAVLNDVYDRVRTGRFADVTDDVERVTGRPARSLDAFIAEHASALRS
jgi:uncharacterized protein YbjT (DUF2867 family)